MIGQPRSVEPLAILLRPREEPEPWVVEAPVRDALETLRRLAGADAAALLALDRRTGAVTPAAVPGADAVPVDGWVRGAMAAQRDRGARDPRPCWVDGPVAGEATLLTPVAERPGRSVFLALRVSGGADARDRLAALAPGLAPLLEPHVDAAARLDGLREERDAAVLALDHGECGVIAVRADQTVVLANAAARAVLAAQAGLHVRRGRVHPTAYADAIRFQEALERVIDPPLDDGAARPPAIAMLLAARAGERPAIIVVSPAVRALPDARGAAAMIYVHHPLTRANRGLEVLCQLHGLTKVEARLTAHLAAGLTVAEAAGEMRIKVETARAYLKQIFGKTGVHRQTELVAMMGRYLRALRGDFDFRAA